MKFKLNRKMKVLLITESVLFGLIFLFSMYCQLFVAGNTFLKSVKFSLMVMIPFLIYCVPLGISFLLRGKFFMGDYESPLKSDDKKDGVSDGDRNYVVANALRM